MGKKGQNEDLLSTLEDFTSKENWDKFFSIRGADDSFEWYAEWPQLRELLLSHISDAKNQPPEVPAAASASAESGGVSMVQILIPGCGNSKLSEHLYDAGFHCITNIDFSKVVISEMLRRNVRLRPDMRWRFMDMTSMQFVDGTFDVVLDKGGLDALMEPKLGPELGIQYISEVKRVLRNGGKFICLTLAESHVLGMLFPKFRYGWKISIDLVPQKPSKSSSLRTFMVIVEKENPTVSHRISPSFDHSSLGSSGDQGRGFYEALETENRIRNEYSSGSDILYTLEDLKLGVKGNLVELIPGRRFQLTLGELGGSRFIYRAVLLDARQESSEFVYHCGVFLVPKTRAHEWLFSSEEGQWMVVESSKAARLIMVFLDASHTASSDEIQNDLSPLVKQLAPGKKENGARIPFMAASDGIKQRKVVHQVISPLTGPIIIDDVIYEKVDGEFSRQSTSKEHIFRRLTFQRSEGLVQSEAFLINQGSHETSGLQGQKKSNTSSKSKKRGNQRRNTSHVPVHDDEFIDLKVDHDYLASSYHTGIISGFMLISSYLERMASAGGTGRAIVIGLGAGLLPMFLHGCIPYLRIEVPELDPVVLDLARDYFGFHEDDALKVHITDGIKFLKNFANIKAEDAPPCDGNGISACTKASASNGDNEVNKKGSVDILIVDVDSSDSSSGMTCPAPDFVEPSFLSTVKDSLSEEGLFIINLVSRSPTIKDLVISRMKSVFPNLFSLQLEEDLNEVIFALNTNASLDFEPSAASKQLEKLLTLKNPEMRQNVMDAAKKIKPLQQSRKG